MYQRRIPPPSAFAVLAEEAAAPDAVSAKAHANGIAINANAHAAAIARRHRIFLFIEPFLLLMVPLYLRALNLPISSLFR